MANTIRSKLLEVRPLLGLMAFVGAWWTGVASWNTPIFGGPPLALHQANPHYLHFRDRPTILIGATEHYGAVLNADFDYVTYLDQIQADGLNLTRIFTGVYTEPQEQVAQNTLAPLPGRLLCPWEHHGERFDLSRWNDAFFARLRDFVAQAGQRGIVVEVSLFCPFYEDTMWNLSPFHPRNHGNALGPITRTDVYTLKHPSLLAIQRDMVRKIVRELKDADNVFYEVCNEPYFGGVTMEWQHQIADTIVACEESLGVRHLIAQNIANGSAKIDRPHPAISIFNFHYAAPPDAVSVNFGLNKALGDDETGFNGQADFTYRREGWDFILAGGTIFNHLDYSFTTEHPRGTFGYPLQQPGGGSPALRKQLAILRNFMARFDFVQMRPIGPRSLGLEGEAYAVYGTTRDPVEFTLPAGKYRLDWINTLTGDTTQSQVVDHPGGSASWPPGPFEEDFALSVQRMH